MVDAHKLSPLAGTFSKHDRRRHQRIKVNLLGRFMLSNKSEFPCQIVNMSPGGAAVITSVQGKAGERVVAYVDHVGRIEGYIVRLSPGGFAITIEATLRKRDKLAAQLTWLANRHILSLPEDRRHERFVPKQPFTDIILPDGATMRCRIIDVSVSGAALAVANKPAIGSKVTVGRMRARVVRHFDDGIGVEFDTVQTHEAIEQQIS